MLNGNGIIIPLVILVLSVGNLALQIIVMIKTLVKFDRLDISVQKKLVRIQYYMVFARRFTTEELIKTSGLSDTEIESLNTIHDVTERVKTARKKIRLLETKMPYK